MPPSPPHRSLPPINPTAMAPMSITGNAISRVDGQYTGTTDVIFRWAACKWGIDEDLVRAIATIEVWRWNQPQSGGEQTDVLFPVCQRRVYQPMGLSVHELLLPVVATYSKLKRYIIGRRGRCSSIPPPLPQTIISRRCEPAWTATSRRTFPEERGITVILIGRCRKRQYHHDAVGLRWFSLFRRLVRRHFYQWSDLVYQSGEGCAVSKDLEDPLAFRKLAQLTSSILAAARSIRGCRQIQPPCFLEPMRGKTRTILVDISTAMHGFGWDSRNQADVAAEQQPGEIALDPCVHVAAVQHDSGGGPFELRAFIAGSDNGVAIHHRP